MGTMRFLVLIRGTKTGYSADVPDLPGCVAGARTLKGVKTRIARAVELHLDFMQQSGEGIPTPRQRVEFEIDPNEREEYCTWIEVAVAQPA
jgi:predicted RNase H-like HicB family nuclease